MLLFSLYEVEIDICGVGCVCMLTESGRRERTEILGKAAPSPHEGVSLFPPLSHKNLYG